MVQIKIILSFACLLYQFIFDEYASFKSWLATQPKEKQNKANATINLLILEGRQLGCHLILAMQKVMQLFCQLI